MLQAYTKGKNKDGCPSYVTSLIRLMPPIFFIWGCLCQECLQSWTWTTMQGRRKLFYGEGAELKGRPSWLADGEKSSPPKGEIWTKIKIIQNLTFGILFFKSISGIPIFYICQHVPVDIIRVIFNFRFSNEVSKLTKTSKKDLSL